MKDKSEMLEARLYWGIMPLPLNSRLVGVHKDRHGVGALIAFDNGNYAVGNAGVLRGVRLSTKGLA